MPTLAVMAGRLRSVVKGLGNLVTPEITKLTENQMLVSGLTPGQAGNIPSTKKGSVASWFTTAVSTTHKQCAIGVLAYKEETDMEVNGLSKKQEKIFYTATVREGKIKVPENFEQKLKENLELLMQFIEQIVL